MDLYIIPEPETVVRAALLLLGAGLAGLLIARHFSYGIGVALCGVVILAWLLVTPLVPPRQLWVRDATGVWQSLAIVLGAALLALILVLVGRRLRRS